MRAVVQRVTYSNVKVDGNIVGEINRGFNVLIGISKEDTEEDMKYIKDKLINLRVFEDENNKMNLSLSDIQGELLIISQFTLYGDVRNSLLLINKNTTLTNFVSQNRANLIELQQHIWILRNPTNQALIVLHNKKYIQLKEYVEVIKTIDYNNYNDDMRKYLRAATYLGLMLKKETLLDVFRILKIVP